jgi:hypothetical protein
MLGLAAAVKFFPAFLAVYFVGRRDFRALLGMSIVFSATVAVSALVLGPQAWVTYVRDVMPQVAGFRSNWINASLPGLWAKLFDPTNLAARIVPLWYNPKLAAILGLSSGVLVATVALRFALRARTRLDTDWAYAITTTGMLLAWPLTWDHGFLILLLPVLLLWSHRFILGRMRVVLVGILAALWVGEDWYWYALTGTRWGTVAMPWQVATVLSVHLYALLALVALECVAATRLARSLPTPAQG